MKVHRLVIVKRISDGLIIGRNECVTTLSDVNDGFGQGDTYLAGELRKGNIVRKSAVYHGISMEITLVPAHAPNRTGLLRKKQDAIERAAIDRLAAANRHVEQNHPLPRCVHGHALRDHGGEALAPPCRCVAPAEELATA